MKDDLAGLAKKEPQAVLCAFNFGLSQRWTFVQRTIKGTSALFKPLEEAIRNTLIQAICRERVSYMERAIIALPFRHGGLGIRNLVVVF